jgi:hypothetical protein
VVVQRLRVERAGDVERVLVANRVVRVVGVERVLSVEVPLSVVRVVGVVVVGVGLEGVVDVDADVWAAPAFPDTVIGFSQAAVGDSV